MGKRGANCLDDPSLIETHQPSSCRRTMSLTSCSSAAMTLLALKQESPTSRSFAASEVGRRTCVQANSATPDEGQRSPSMCSSVTDDDGSTVGDESTSYFGDACSTDSPRSGHELIPMALVRPKLRLVSFYIDLPSTLSIPSWKIPPEGRPLAPPGRLPKGLVFASSYSKKTRYN